MADWLEVPNLRDRSNRFMKYLAQEYALGIEVPPEPYMTLGRRSLFVFYAITSYLYRWIVTFSIIYFLYRFLAPYKLETIGHLLTLSAVGTMVGWPAFRMGKGLHKRGRLPDMKPLRVTLSATFVAAVILFVFLVPVPVGRVRSTALVQVEPDALERVYAPVPGKEGVVLEKLHVRDGQRVAKDEVLAEFRSLEIETQLEEARSQYDTRRIQIASIRRQMDGVTDPADKGKLQAQLGTAINEREHYKSEIDVYEKAIGMFVLRAPRSGVVMSSPKVDDIGKLWEKEPGAPFCSIGDPSRLQALVPISPAEYRLLKDDLERAGELPVDIRVQGRAEVRWKGKVLQLPESEAKEVPPQLTSKFGGPLAVKPTTQPNSYQPQAQQYLVSVEFLHPEPWIYPGTLAQVKIHCRWHPVAWWIWRWVHSTFDIGLL